MFTGLIGDVGCVKNVLKRRGACTLTISSTMDVAIGDSVCTSGACLTVTEQVKGGFKADVMPETLRKSKLSRLKAGDRVNLEQALAVGTRLDGHLVSGHVDEVLTVASIRREGNAVRLVFRGTARTYQNTVPMGSIAIDGVSLTVADRSPRQVVVSIIPHTYAATTLSRLKCGHSVNVEYDGQVKSSVALTEAMLSAAGIL
ncbi:riboflavin synthase [Fusibacter sp. JL298sf-3]